MARFQIDLRSDTKSLPTEGMRQAIARAELGDEQSGEDPTVNALCARVARLLGKEDALLLPSGTMCNHIALLVHGRPGDEIIAAASSHIVTSESGGAAALAGLQIHGIACERGIFGAEDVAGALRPTKRNAPRSSIVVVEQTTNLGGGAIWPTAVLDALRQVADAHGMCIHMDGARLLNAVVASGVPAATFCGPCDSAWLDLSKGLGCPVGAVLAGSFEFIRQAWVWKQRLGGAMRQAGIFAAAGLYALDHHVARLADDHTNARALAEGLSRLPWVRVAHTPVETNIVFLDVSASGRTASDAAAFLAAHGIGIGVDAPFRLRAVTHLGITRQDIGTTIDLFGRLDQT
ncbi:threonine aldolase family protein [Pseudochelatococcus sp. B33]